MFRCRKKNWKMSEIYREIWADEQKGKAEYLKDHSVENKQSDKNNVATHSEISEEVIEVKRRNKHR